MSVTVQEALQLEIFARCRLLTTEKGLQNQIYWVNILEILDDLSHIEPGEFLITTAHGFQALNEKKQLEIIEFLSSRKMAALAIQTGHYLTAIPASLVNHFNRAAIPLIEIPSDISFKSITRSLMLALLQAEKTGRPAAETALSEIRLRGKYRAAQELWNKALSPTDPAVTQQAYLKIGLKSDRHFWICRIAGRRESELPAIFPVETELDLREQIGQALYQIMEQRQVPYLIGTVTDNLTLLVQPAPQDNISGKNSAQFARRILEELKLLCPQLQIYLGLSESSNNLEGWRKTAAQAEKALQAASLGLLKQGGFAGYGSLGSLKLILAVDELESLEELITGSIRPLIDYDRRTGGALVETLRVYLKHLKIKAAAGELYVHRHTLKYRLNQVKKLTGFNPEEATAVVQLSLALQVYDYLLARGLNNR